MIFLISCQTMMICWMMKIRLWIWNKRWMMWTIWRTHKRWISIQIWIWNKKLQRICWGTMLLMRVRPNIWMMIIKTAAVDGVIQTHMDDAPDTGTTQYLDDDN